MPCLPRVTKIIAVIMLVLLLTLSLPACAPAAQPEAKSATSLVVVPKIIDLKARSIQVLGSGFTPGTTVAIGFPGLLLHEDVPESGLWVGGVTVNQSGAFSYSVGLRNTLWKFPEKNLGVHTVVADNKLGEIATAPLLVVKPPEEK